MCQRWEEWGWNMNFLAFLNIFCMEKWALNYVHFDAALNAFIIWKN